MAALVTYNNPFKLTETTTETVDIEVYKTSFVLKEYLQEKIGPMYDIIIVRNGKVVEEDFEITSNDIVGAVVRPAGNTVSSIIKVVVLVVVAVYAPELLGAMGAGTFTAATATTAASFTIGGSALYGSLAVAALTVGASMLLNAVLPPQMPSLSVGSSGYSNLQNSQTYSWGTQTNTISPGDVLPKLFGKTRITPKLIAKTVVTDGTLQYLDMLFVVSDGPVDSVSSIEINNTPLADLDEVTVETRLGTLTQTPISTFSTTRTDTPVGVKLWTADYAYSAKSSFPTTGVEGAVYYDKATKLYWKWATNSYIAYTPDFFKDVVTGGDQVVELTSGLVFPRGLYYTKDDGSLGEASVKVRVEYTSTPSIDTSWKSMSLDLTKPLTYSEYYQKDDSTGVVSVYSDSNCATKIGTISSIPAAAIVTTPATAAVARHWKIGVGWVAASLARPAIYGLPDTYIPYTTVTDNVSSTFRKTFTIKNLPPAQYHIRARIEEEPEHGTRYGTDVIFEFITEGISDHFSYPGLSLLSVHALATNQLNGGLPAVTCIADNSSVPINSLNAVDAPFFCFGTCLQDDGVLDIAIGKRADGSSIIKTAVPINKRWIALMDSLTYDADGTNHHFSYFDKGTVKLKLHVDAWGSFPAVSGEFHVTFPEAGYYHILIPDETTVWDSLSPQDSTLHPNVDGDTSNTDGGFGYNASTKTLTYGNISSNGMPSSAMSLQCANAEKAFNNPAVVCKQILLDSGIAPEFISSNFDTWALFCVANGLTCNIYFDGLMDVKQCLNLVSSLGRGTVVQFGSNFDIIVDKAGDVPVQGFTFGMGNILKDSFKQSFLPLENRANVIEVTFYDETNNYARTVFEVGADQYDSTPDIKKTSINLIGCVSKEKAHDHAKLLLNSNRYLTQSYTFQADVDAIYCKIGDIIRLSHDIPMIGESGRVVDAAPGYVVLDRSIDIPANTRYYMTVRNLTNNIITTYTMFKSSVPSSGPMVFFNSNETNLPHPGDLYSIGEIPDMLARVVAIRTTGEFIREITCVEYNQSIYNLTGTPTVRDYTHNVLGSLVFDEYITATGNGNIFNTIVVATWVGNSLKYTITCKRSKLGTIAFDKTFISHTNSYTWDNVLTAGETYNITIKDDFGNKISTTYTVQGKTTPPPTPKNINVTESGGKFLITWDYDYYPVDFKEFQITMKTPQGTIFNKVGATTAQHFTYVYTGLTSEGTYLFNVSATDKCTPSKASSAIQGTVLVTAPAMLQSSQVNISGYGSEYTFTITGYTKPDDFKQYTVVYNNKTVMESTNDTFVVNLNPTVGAQTFSIYVKDTSGLTSSALTKTSTYTNLPYPTNLSVTLS